MSDGSLLISSGFLGIFLCFFQSLDIMIPWLIAWFYLGRITIPRPFPNLDFQGIDVGVY